MGETRKSPEDRWDRERPDGLWWWSLPPFVQQRSGEYTSRLEIAHFDGGKSVDVHHRSPALRSRLGPRQAAGYSLSPGKFAEMKEQINSITTDLTNVLKGIAADVAPVTTGLVGVVFNVVIVGMVSIYLVLDGSRFLKWATGNTPIAHRRNISFFIQSLDRVMGGYIRGQLLLCLAIAVMIAIFMAIIRVPF
jgi:predicted PurR-regulated permease PerM